MFDNEIFVPKSEAQHKKTKTCTNGNEEEETVSNLISKEATDQADTSDANQSSKVDPRIANKDQGSQTQTLKISILNLNKDSSVSSKVMTGNIQSFKSIKSFPSANDMTQSNNTKSDEELKQCPASVPLTISHPAFSSRLPSCRDVLSNTQHFSNQDKNNTASKNSFSNAS